MKYAQRVSVTLAVAAGLLVPVIRNSAFAQETRPTVISHFTDWREAKDAQISPDGRFVAFVVDELTTNDQAHRFVPGIWLVATDGSAPARRLTPAGRAATAPAWSKDSRSISFLTAADKGGNQIFIRPVASGEARQLSRHETPIGKYSWSPDGKEIAFTAVATRERPPRSSIVTVVGGAQPTSTAGHTTLSLLDVKDGSARAITASDLNIREFAWAPDGQQFAVIATGKAVGGNSLAVINRNGAVVRKLADNPGGFGTRRQILDWSPDGHSIIFAHLSPNAVGHWIGVVPATGGAARELLRDYDGTIMRVVWAPDSKYLIAQSFEKLSSHLLRIDAASGKVTRLAEAYTSYPDFSVTANGRAIAFLGSLSDAPPEVWAYRAGERAPKRLTHLNPQLNGLSLGNVTEFRWKSSRDSTEIHGALITPPGYTSDRRWPTVVQIHGGPHFHWGLGWLGDWHDWAQLLATNGYVVLLPNPRGSTGRSWDFANAISRDLGGVDYQDIMDGTDALIARGIADPERLGVGGWSFGGYLTAWTVTQTDRFKAAVMGAGISNFFSFAGMPGIGRTDMEFRFGGDAYTARAAVEDRSPITHVRNAKTPTLIVHGENDAKISPMQAWEFYTALDHLGVATQLVLYPRTGHVISIREQRMDYLERVLCWYDKYLQNKACT